jgi:hypothetical protein
MEGFVVAKALEVNVPEAERIEAADLVVYQLPQKPGLAAVHDGVVSALASAEERSYKGAGGPFTMGATYCCWARCLGRGHGSSRGGRGPHRPCARPPSWRRPKPVELFKVKREPPPRARV